MDIGVMSMGMHQACLQNAVSVSVLKITMNSEAQVKAQITDMMNNMSVDTSKGTNIDVRA